jgi:hypothetical protein
LPLTPLSESSDLSLYLTSHTHAHLQFITTYNTVIMGFFDDAWKAMDGFGQEAAKHIGPAAAEAWKQADKFGQEQLAPAAAETLLPSCHDTDRT